MSDEKKKGFVPGMTLAIFMIIMQSFLYGLLDPLLRWVYLQFPNVCFMFLRFSIAALVLFIIWHKSILRDLKKAPLRSYIIPGLCMGSSFVFGNNALARTAATNVAFLRSLSALMVPILLLIFFHKRYTLKTALIQFMMLIGLYLLCSKGGLSGFGLGEVLSLICGFCVAMSLVFGKEALKYMDPITLSFVQSGFSTLVTLLWGCFSGGLIPGSDTPFTWSIFGVLMLASLGATIGGYLLQNYALKTLPARTAGVLQTSYPLMTAFFAFIILGELLSPSGMLGAGLILCGMIAESLWRQE